MPLIVCCASKLQWAHAVLDKFCVGLGPPTYRLDPYLTLKLTLNCVGLGPPTYRLDPYLTQKLTLNSIRGYYNNQNEFLDNECKLKRDQVLVVAQ